MPKKFAVIVGVFVLVGCFASSVSAQQYTLMVDVGSSGSLGKTKAPARFW
jgi:hypothetical protein